MPESGMSDRGHRRAAVIAATAITVLACLAVPFDQVMLPANPGFMPAFGAFIVLTEGLTAGLLMVQSKLRGSGRLRYLGAAYLFAALTVIPHLLAFPGVFAPTPIIGGSDTAIWLWCVWHGGFPIGVLCFLFAGERPSPGHLPRLVATVILIVAGLTLVAASGSPWLPKLLQNGNFHHLTTSGIGPAILLLCLLAASLVLIRLQARDPLSAWLFVALVAATLDVTLTMFGGGRFTLGWYSARMLSLITGVTVLFSLLSELIREAAHVAHVNEQLEHLLCTDVLTRVANRRAFDAALASEWKRACRAATPISLLMIDVDFFKRFNDRYGHPAGDECLRLVAGAIRSELKRPADLAARLGGEEFGLLLPMTDAAGAWHVAERVRAEVNQLALPHAMSHLARVTVSIGVGTAYPHIADGDTGSLMDVADRALYDAKAAGRDTICGARADIPLRQGELLATLAP